MIQFVLVLVLTASIAVFSVASHLSLFSLLTTFVTFLIMAFGGVVLLKRVIPAEESPVYLAVFGAATGILLGRYGLLAMGLATGLHPRSVISLYVILLVAALASAFSRPLDLRWSVEDTREVPWILAIPAVVTALIAIPYSGVGRLTELGYAFVPYFRFDFLNHVSITAELTRSIPPQNPYFAGETLHYYWFYHLWPAAIVQLTGGIVKEAVVATLLPTIILFIGLLFLTVRSHVSDRRASILATAIGIFAPSYIGILYAVQRLAPQLLRRIPNYSYMEYSYLSHSWFRDFLFEPHAVTALIGILLVVYLDRRGKVSPGWQLGVLMGSILGTILITDIFIGIIGLCYFGLSNVFGFFSNREARKFAIVSGVFAGLSIIFAVWLGILPLGSSGVLTVALHPLTKYLPLYLTAELGPIFLIGAIGIYSSIRYQKNEQMTAMYVLFAVTLVLAFGLLFQLDQDIALRKSIKVLQVPFVVFIGTAAALHMHLLKRWLFRTIAVLIVLPGVVTITTDIAQYTNLLRKRTPPVSYVSPDGMLALDWIRVNTPHDAIVQDLNLVRPGRKYHATDDGRMTGLAERRTLFGNYEHPYIFRVTQTKLDERKSILEKTFKADSPEELESELKQFPPFYLYVDASLPGPHSSIRTLEARGFLKPMYNVAEISVFAVGQ
jgi:hypothetical protein